MLGFSSDALTCTEWKNLSLRQTYFQLRCPAFSFPLYRKDVSFTWSAQGHALWGFLLVILLFQVSPTCCAGSLSGACKHKKAVMCFTQKILVFGKLHLGLAYTAALCEFTTNKSTISSVLNEAEVKMLVAQLCLTLCNPMDCSLLKFLSMELFRQEY